MSQDNISPNEVNLRTKTYSRSVYTPSYLKRGRNKDPLNNQEIPGMSGTPQNMPPKTARTPINNTEPNQAGPKNALSANKTINNLVPPKPTGTKKKDSQNKQVIPESGNSNMTLDEDARRVNDILNQYVNQTSSMEDLVGARYSAPLSILDLEVPVSGQIHKTLDPNPSLLAELKRCKERIRDLTLQANQNKTDNNQRSEELSNNTQSEFFSHSNASNLEPPPRNQHLLSQRQPQRPHSNRHEPPLEPEPSDSEDLSYTDQRRPREPRRSHQPCQMNKWPIKFSSGNGLKFLKKVEKLQASYGYDDDTVYKYFYLLLEGHAMEWYWQFSDEYPISNLSHLKSEFSRVFKPRETDMTLISAMYSKKQGRDSFEKFYNDLVDMNFTLKNPLPDLQIIEILRSNMDDDVRQRIFTFETRDRINFFHKANQAYRDVCGVREKRKSFYEYKNTKKINEIDFEEKNLRIGRQKNHLSVLTVRVLTTC